MKQPLLGKKITELRHKKGMTQKELADACRIDIRTIQRIESGDVLPRMYTIKLLLSTLNAGMQDISTNDAQMEAPITRQLKLSLIAAILNTINYVIIVYQLITNSFGSFAYALMIGVQIVTFIFFTRGFYFLGKRSGNHIMATTALISMVLLPLLNIMDVFKAFYFNTGIFTLFTVVCIVSLISGIGFLMEAQNNAAARKFYTIAGVTILVQSCLFLSASLELINTGLILSIFSNVILCMLLYHESKNVKLQQSGEVNTVLG